MNTDLFTIKSAGRAKPGNKVSAAIDIAIRDAEKHGTDLIVKSNGKVRKVSPKVMKRRLARTKT